MNTMNGCRTASRHPSGVIATRTIMLLGRRRVRLSPRSRDRWPCSGGSRNGRHGTIGTLLVRGVLKKDGLGLAGWWLPVLWPL